MKRFIVWVAFLLAGFSLFSQGRQDLKVLYVGGSSDFENRNANINDSLHGLRVAERTAAFESYLQSYFKNVTIVRGEDYRPDLSAAHDVTIFDGNIPQRSPAKITIDENGRPDRYYGARYLTEDFSYPALLIADMGEVLGRSIGLKTDWYCLCLDAHAHHFNTTPFSKDRIRLS